MKVDKTPKPPRLGKFILKTIYDDDLYQDIAGDFQELFEDRSKTEGSAMASLKYIRDAALSSRNIDLKRRQTSDHFNRTGMLKSYIKMALRVLRKNASTSFITIVGFATAVACTITSFLYADFMGHLDTFHAHRESIYQVISHIEEEGEDIQYGSSPMLLAGHLKSEHPGVVAATRLKYHVGAVRFADQVFNERLLFVDHDFLQMFDFPLLSGNRNSLDEKRDIMLSENMAVKYFGVADPMGKKITIKFTNDMLRSYYVSGVFAKAPENATFSPEIVLGMDNYLGLGASNIDWSVDVNATFVQLREHVGPDVLTNLMTHYQKIQNKGNPAHEVTHFELFSLVGLGNRAEHIYQPVSYGNSKSGIYGMAIIGVLILILACLNYLNIAVSSGARRLKEIAIRKVMGSSRQNIIYQFLIENAIICGFSIIMGAVLCYYIMLPGFNLIAPVDVPFNFSSIERTVGFYTTIWIFVAILSGAYPAFYISRYQPSTIFNGKQKFNGKNYLSRGLLGLQLFMAFTTIVGSFVFTDNAMFVKSLDWGYDPDNVLSIKIDGQGQFNTLQSFIESNQAVVFSGGSRGHIGVDNQFVNFEYLDKQFRAIGYDVSPGYLQTLRINLQQGRPFATKDALSETNSIIVNQDFVEKMNWTNAIGQQIVYNGVRKNVIGVVGNIHHSFFSKDITRPMIFTSEGEQDYNFITIKYAPGQFVELDQAIEAKFHQLAPNDPYDRIYQDEIFNRYYDTIDANTSIMMTISIMAILLSCLGLYGLMAFSIQRRIKEFGIRIVLGAKDINIIRLAVKEYAWILIFAFTIGVPIGTWLIQETITELFTVSKPFSFVPVLLAIGITLLSIVLTVLGEILRAIRINPSETLKD